MTSRKVGSLFSGIGGFELGLERAGMQVAWSCEKDPDARAVLAERWPDVPCYDDVKELSGDGLTAVDVLCGGFPCQDLSVAGRRKGLAGERSGLFHEFMRLAGELAPSWVLIENVPGLLSSNDGRDMGVVVGVLADLGYGWAYRVLDAQYFGVAQRRHRVFIVGCAGGRADRAAQVLFEPESCDGDSPPRRETGQRVAASLTAGTASGSGVNPPGRRQEDDINIVTTLQGGGRRGHRIDAEGAAGGHLIPFHVTQDPISGDVFPAMGTGNSQGCGTLGVAYPLAMRGRADGAELEMGDEGVYNALRAGDGGSSRQNLVMAFAQNQRGELVESDYAHQLTAGGGKPGEGYPAVREDMAVRRLMPIECERLQGFPDNWTAGQSDSARYRMLGNAVCVPVAEWIGHRMGREKVTEPMTAVERIAKAFHDAYEEQADFYGWKPQGSTRVQWADLPTANKALMLSVVDTLLHDGVILAPVTDGQSSTDDSDGGDQGSNDAIGAERF